MKKEQDILLTIFILQLEGTAKEHCDKESIDGILPITKGEEITIDTVRSPQGQRTNVTFAVVDVGNYLTTSENFSQAKFFRRVVHLKEIPTIILPKKEEGK